MSDLFLRACRGEKVERTPIWIMRQAGRYLAEYRAVREKVEFSKLCRTPDLATEVTMQPIDRFGFDAAILFSDIMVLAEPLGFDVRFEPGPVLDHPVRTVADIERIDPSAAEGGLDYVNQTIRNLRRELEGRASLIGFAAAPFTLAAYLVEGKGSKNFEKIKSLLFAEPVAARQLMDKIADATATYALAQVEAGAQAIQLFDSWAGLLDPKQYREFALEPARRVIDALAAAGVPRIYFALNSGHLFEEIRECGAEVVGVDWRTPLDEASRRLDNRFVLQGNLDPCALFAPVEQVREEATRILKQAEKIPGHVFNLGHGVLPKTPVESVQALVECVQSDVRTTG
jgi:uroporphyrinogen decarboxylase